jgi:hypothetical protein
VERTNDSSRSNFADLRLHNPTDMRKSFNGGRLLPDRWAQEHPESIGTYRQQESLARAAQTKARRVHRRRLHQK